MATGSCRLQADVRVKRMPQLSNSDCLPSPEADTLVEIKFKPGQWCFGSNSDVRLARPPRSVYAQLLPFRLMASDARVVQALFRIAPVSRAAFERRLKRPARNSFPAALWARGAVTEISTSCRVMSNTAADVPKKLAGTVP